MTVGDARHGPRPTGRLSVEAWSPDYGAPMEAGVDDAESAPIDVDVEVPAAAWDARRPPTPSHPPTVAFVDGVRRVDANVMWSADDGRFHTGLAASVAAGVVRCNGTAEVTRVAIDRVLLLGVDLDDVETRHGVWRYRRPQSRRDDPGQLSIELQQVMADLEVAVATGAGQDDELDLVVVDGPIRRRESIRRAVGHVKTHHQRYLPPSVSHIIGELEAGDRTPIFRIGGPFPRLSWYLRLPCPRQHPWSGVVRHEIAVDEMAAARALADLSAAAVPRYASSAARDPRAPQNLTPVGGLESRLRHRLGDATLLYRALRAALA